MGFIKTQAKSVVDLAKDTTKVDKNNADIEVHNDWGTVEVIDENGNKKLIPVYMREDEVDETNIGEAPVSDVTLREISDDLIAKHNAIVLKAIFDNYSRQLLRGILVQNYSARLKSENEIEYVLAEVVGTGFIEKLLKIPNVTDIAWTGTHLVVETPDLFRMYTAEELGIKDMETYLQGIISKFANAVGKSFNEAEPELNAEFMSIRINAIHSCIGVEGTTMALRIVRPSLALTEERFDSLAPNFVLDFFKDFMVTTGNMCVAGETGTGKTELSKLVLGYVPNEDRIVSIQDVNELHLSKLYPGRNIMNWLTKEKKFTIADGVKASLRANPKWIVVAETRGAEAWELLQATLTGHFMITTLHANSALMIPRRFVSMAKTAVDIDEGLLMEDILTNFDLGAFIKRITYVDRHGNGHTIRYLAELVEYGVDKSRMLFKQEFRRGQFYVTSGQEQISEGLARRMEEVDLEPFQFPVLDNEPITKACIEAWNKESNTEQQEKDMAILDEVMTS